MLHNNTSVRTNYIVQHVFQLKIFLRYIYWLNKNIDHKIFRVSSTVWPKYCTARIEWNIAAAALKPAAAAIDSWSPKTWKRTITKWRGRQQQ